MRSSRAMLYLQRLDDLASQLSELEDLRDLVEYAERAAVGAPAFRSRRHASRRLGSRGLGALSVRLRSRAPPSTNVGPPQNDN